VEITTRGYDKIDEPGGTISYRQQVTRGMLVTQVNTREAVARAEHLLAAFRGDSVC